MPSSKVAIAREIVPIIFNTSTSHFFRSGLSSLSSDVPLSSFMDGHTITRPAAGIEPSNLQLTRSSTLSVYVWPSRPVQMTLSGSIMLSCRSLYPEHLEMPRLGTLLVTFVSTQSEALGNITFDCESLTDPRYYWDPSYTVSIIYGYTRYPGFPDQNVQPLHHSGP